MLTSSYSYQLAQRTFHTFDFYKKHQDAMTPAGLAFFQCRWDDSVTHIFHQLLGKGRVGKGEGAAGLSAQTSPDMPGEAPAGEGQQQACYSWGGLAGQSPGADRRTGSGQQQSTPVSLLHSSAGLIYSHFPAMGGGTLSLAAQKLPGRSPLPLPACPPPTVQAEHGHADPFVTRTVSIKAPERY